MLHKSAEPSKTVDKYNILQNYSCFACYQDSLYTGHGLDIKRFVSIGDIAIWYDKAGVICGPEITMSKNLQFFF